MHDASSCTTPSALGNRVADAGVFRIEFNDVDAGNQGVEDVSPALISRRPSRRR